MARRDVRLGSTVEIYRDPETETQLEGYAFVWHIEKETDRFFTLMVSFLGDREERKVLRDLKKKQIAMRKPDALGYQAFSCACFLCMPIVCMFCGHVYACAQRIHERTGKHWKEDAKF